VGKKPVQISKKEGILSWKGAFRASLDNNVTTLRHRSAFLVFKRGERLTNFLYHQPPRGGGVLVSILGNWTNRKFLGGSRTKPEKNLERGDWHIVGYEMSGNGYVK